MPALDVDAPVRSCRSWALVGRTDAFSAITREPTSSASAREEGSAASEHSRSSSRSLSLKSIGRRVSWKIGRRASAGVVVLSRLCACLHLRRRDLAQSPLRVRASARGGYVFELDQSWCHRHGVTDSVLDGRAAGAFPDGTVVDQKAAVLLYALIASLMSAAWLPAFIHLRRHPQLLKPDLPEAFFAPQVRRPVTGIFLFVAGAALGWFAYPLQAVGVFAVAVGYHAWTSQGIDSGR
jgi:hypothetical protein